jgi:hypothetical protein
MSQQELLPEPQDQQPENEDEIYAPQYPYSWSGKSSAEGVPRDEPPSSYEYEAGYQAQDAYGSPPQPFDAASEYTQPAQQMRQTQQTQQTQPAQPARQYQYNPYDGDAYEQGYNPYNNSAAQNNMNQGVPPWARPQPQARGGFRFGSILLLLIVISMLTTLGHGFLFYDVGHLLGWFFGMLFFPIFILMMILGSIRRGGRRRYWRGPWGW